MNGDDFARPSTLVAAVALGWLAAGALLLADVAQGDTRDWRVYPLLGAVVAAAVLGFWHGGLGLLAFGLLVWDAWTVRRPTPPESPAPDGDSGNDAAPDPEPVRRAAWDAANIILFIGGDKAGGYSQPKMGGMISSDPWQTWTEFYAANPEGEPVLQRVPGKVGTKLAFRWSLTRVLFAIARGELPTPPGPPPSVREFTPERRAAEKADNSAGVVVEGVVTRAD